MVRLLGTLGVTAAWQVARIQAMPAPDLNGVGLTILASNDLENNPSPGSGAILLDTAVDQSTAEKLCRKLSESLWSTEDDEALDSIVTSLEYQVYQGNYDSGSKFWAGGKKGDKKGDKKDRECKCTSIDVHGTLRPAKCSERLPVLCTQSAAASNMTVEDNSKRLQVTRNVGGARVTGYRDFFSWRFRGIRYAPEPQRFEYSTALGEMTGDIKALKAGADCLQPDLPTSQDDCLFLNVWTPFLPATEGKAVLAKTELKPVIVWIYGGGFVTGSGSNPLLDMGNHASRGDVVGVTFNYRMGNLGLLAFDDGVHNGNIMLNDEINALKWVKENIAAFGGDPDRITIAGESSGAISVRLLMTSPEAEGLYSKAYLQSDALGGVGEPWGLFWSKEQSYAYFTEFVLDAVDCQDATDKLDCLRQVPGQQLANLEGDRGTALYPVIDGKYLTAPYFAVDGSGPRYAKDIPAMMGSTRDEGGVNEALAAFPWDNMNFDTWQGIFYLYKDLIRIDVDAVFANLDLFGVTTESLNEDFFFATAKIFGSSLFTCLDRATAYSGAKNDVFEKVYAFNFNRTYSPYGYTNKYCDAPITPDHPYGDPDLEYLKCHSGNQIPTFGNYKRAGYPDRDGLDIPFSRLIIDYFTSFAHTGDPNPDPAYLKVRGYQSTLEQVSQVGEWSTVDPENPKEMVMQWNGKMVPFPERELCAVMGQPLDYWENL